MLSPVSHIRVGGPDHAVTPVDIGGGAPLVLIAGPCVLESEAHAGAVCAATRAICDDLGLQFIFKASFDKANRTSLHSFRGPGLGDGLEMLRRIREGLGVPVTTDVHLPAQAAEVARVVDLLQVPAFLCRQTDLLVACARTGKPVNVKKGQFMAPTAMGAAVAKLVASGANGVMITERGVSFGYGDLVVDMRALPITRGLGVPVCFDATHSVQKPGGLGDRTGGDRAMVPFLARAAAGAGVDALFLEVHDDPDNAPSDGPNMVPLADLRSVLEGVLAVDRAVRGAGPAGDDRPPTARG